MKRRWDNLGMHLMDQAGATGGSGGATSLLTSDQGGGSGGSTQGNAGSVSGTDKQAAAADSSAGGSSGGNAASDWKSQLPAELQKDATLSKFTDISTLARSYINAQKLIGADKVPVPNKNFSDEDWKNFYAKIGLPESVDKYEIKPKNESVIDKEFLKNFKETAHKSGVLPKQAQQLIDWFTDVSLESGKKFEETQKAAYEKEISGLKEEWGNAFDLKLSQAKKVLSTYADKEMLEYLDSSGLGNNTKLVRLLSKIGQEVFKEDSEKGGGAGFSEALSPAEAIKKANDIMADKEHPYYNKSHPNHKAAVQEVQNLFNMAYNKA